MKIAVVSNDYLYNNTELFTQAVSSIYSNVKCRFWPCLDSDNIYEELVSFQPSLLITENLAGFHMSTYMGNTAYNLLHCMQIHLLYDILPFTDQQAAILEKPLSLSMHFMCCDEKTKKETQIINPDIPFIDTLPSPSPCISDILSMITVLTEKGTSE